MGPHTIRPQLEEIQDPRWACALSSTQAHRRHADGIGRVKLGPLGAEDTLVAVVGALRIEEAMFRT